MKKAAIDYRYLLNRDYPQKASIKLVGDKYQLSGTERSMLYRGISSKHLAEWRYSKKTDVIHSGPIIIDGHNVLFTMANYLMGRQVYLSDDGYLRDAAESHGRFGNKLILDKAKNLLKSFILNNSGFQYEILLDAPVSNSGKLALHLNAFLIENGISGKARTEASPDFHLISAPEGTVCSGDSVVIERTSLKVFDLSFQILNEKFNPPFVDLSGLFN